MYGTFTALSTAALRDGAFAHTTKLQIHGRSEPVTVIALTQTLHGHVRSAYAYRLTSKTSTNQS
jgi:hypothetical protein